MLIWSLLYLFAGFTVASMLYAWDDQVAIHKERCGTPIRFPDLYQCNQCRIDFRATYTLCFAALALWPLFAVALLGYGFVACSSRVMDWYGGKIRSGVESLPAIRVTFTQKQLPPPSED